MRGQIESLLDKGIKAARAGEKARARDILLHVVELDQRNGKAWLWLSSVVETHADKEVCLENVLAIDPKNVYATTGLQHLRQQPRDVLAPPSSLPRLPGVQASVGEERDTSAAPAPPPPSEHVCPRCGLRNPGWAYLCDRCGSDLRPVDVHQTLRPAFQPRERRVGTLLDAWSGMLVFNRLYAFGPELELASWGRGLVSLGLAALLVALWRLVTTILLWVMVGAAESAGQLAVNALLSAVQTLPPAPLLVLVCGGIALLTWQSARLLDGEQSFKVHAHVIAVAFSAWVILVALLVPLTILLPYLLGGRGGFDQFLGVVSPLVSIAVAATGAIWLTQAVRTAQDLPAVRAILAALMLAGLLIALFGFDRLLGSRLADLVSELVGLLFLPLSVAGR